jgi:hypothetical protein
MREGGRGEGHMMRMREVCRMRGERGSYRMRERGGGNEGGGGVSHGVV